VLGSEKARTDSPRAMHCALAAAIDAGSTSEGRDTRRDCNQEPDEPLYKNRTSPAATTAELPVGCMATAQPKYGRESRQVVLTASACRLVETLSQMTEEAEFSQKAITQKS
jgi:hypothetical protein